MALFLLLFELFNSVYGCLVLIGLVYLLFQYQHRVVLRRNDLAMALRSTDLVILELAAFTTQVIQWDNSLSGLRPIHREPDLTRILCHCASYFEEMDAYTRSKHTNAEHLEHLRAMMGRVNLFKTEAVKRYDATRKKYAEIIRVQESGQIMASVLETTQALCGPLNGTNVQPTPSKAKDVVDLIIENAQTLGDTLTENGRFK